MNNDKLTRAERIRLEAFSQVNSRYQITPIKLEQHMREAEKVEKWLREANSLIEKGFV